MKSHDAFFSKGWKPLSYKILELPVKVQMTRTTTQNLEQPKFIVTIILHDNIS